MAMIATVKIFVLKDLKTFLELNFCNKCYTFQYGLHFNAPMGGLCTCCQCKVNDCRQQKPAFFRRDSRVSVRVLPECPKNTDEELSKTDLENYAASYVEKVLPEGKPPESPEISIEEQHSITNSYLPVPIKQTTAYDIVLERCRQSGPISFTDFYTESLLQDCKKIGEGVYGEVFEYTSCDIKTVMKIIPIEGNQIVNGEYQKKFEEIISEIIISMELSNLRYGYVNQSCGFSEVQQIRCVKGCYPNILIDLWNMWNKKKKSDNDSPEMFKENQLYVVLELAHAGHDMEEFVFKNSVQAFSLLKQIAFSLAIAETSLKFEHRDLHWGNVLISLIEHNKSLHFYLDGKKFIVPSCGILGSIIDFTLSRITHNSVCIFNDLSLDPDLFRAKGDYQFDVYRLMREHNGNEWSAFNPYTNVLWLHYIIDKMVEEVKYKYPNTKIHTTGIEKLSQLKNVILGYSSVKELVIGEFYT